MRRTTITFRIDSEKKRVLDAVAAGLDRDRSYVINEAIRSYLEIYKWQIEHIKEGIRQADAEQFAGQDEVSRAFAKLKKSRAQ